MQDKQHIRAWVSGKVQGVWYRNSTRQVAERLHILGYAKNLPDGRVEVLAYGDAEAVSQLINWLHDGPEAAIVTEVQTEQVEGETPPLGFEVC
ncbi:acylphosphatase [Hahella sp. KA22]|uniref:acylphosphatase n=1 Tax=Hahella sp. KA22 TaxID=1628392 RepID=UPI000FDDED7D|nr:acylphosphatase [Hahella sp. KA22]AZZ93380.1 acylphosphatase [Hahella sp. KA22]QAY56755.1 acylphosphatase [Hahella sp. KA22]